MIRGGPRLVRWACEERGIALICALVVTSLLTVLGGALVLLVTTETMISSHHRTAQDAFYAADAGIERAVGTLRRTGDWSTVLASACAGPTSDLCDGTSPPRAGDGTLLDLVALTAARQSESAARYGSRGPVWSLFAHAPLDRLLSLGSIHSPAYVVVWVADDAEDPDGDPMHDTNGVLMVRAEGFGATGARRAVEVTVARERAEVRLVSWRSVR